MKFKNRKLEIGKDDETTQSIVSLSMPDDFIIYAPPLQSSSTAGNSSRSSRSQHPSAGFESSMALTIFILVTALFFMGFFSAYLRCVASGRRRRRSRTFISDSRLQQLVAAAAAAAASSLDINNNPSKDNDQGLDPTIIRSLPILPYHNYIMGSTSIINGGIRIRIRIRIREDDADKDDCVVCLCEYEEGEMVKVIPNCGHLFHPECIDLWFISHSSCPLCRSTQLFPPSPDHHHHQKKKPQQLEEDDEELMKSTVAVLRRAYSFSGNCTSSSSDYSSSSSLLGGGGGEGDNIERLVMLKRSSSWSYCLYHACI